MKKKESAINLVLSLAKQARENQTSWCGGFHIDKSIFEFCQSMGSITYREMRNVASTLAKIKKTQKDLIESLKEKFNHKGYLNWVLCHFDDDFNQGDDPEFYPQSIGEDGAVVSHREEIREIIKQDDSLFKKNKEFRLSLSEFSKNSESIYAWIHQLFVGGTLEADIERFLKQKENKKTQARMSKMLVGNLIKPEISNAVEEVGEPPTLSTSERQTLHFLLWKYENMNDTEKRLKDLLLDGKNENPKRNGICVCFEESEAILNAYGETSPAGFHYNEMKASLKSLSEKNRKLVLRNEKEELKISVPLIKKADLEHRFKHEPEFKKYVAVYLDAQILDLGEKYTAFPSNHFALLRHTPPKTRLTEQEVKFFDILYDEVSYISGKKNIVRRKKGDFLKQLDIDGSFHGNRLLSRLANTVEKKYVEKGLNLGLLEKFTIEVNRYGEEIYVFTINAKEKIPVFQN
jgi:hypothetical protein